MFRKILVWLKKIKACTGIYTWISRRLVGWSDVWWGGQMGGRVVRRLVGWSDGWSGGQTGGRVVRRLVCLWNVVYQPLSQLLSHLIETCYTWSLEYSNEHDIMLVKPGQRVIELCLNFRNWYMPVSISPHFLWQSGDRGYTYHNHW